MKVNEKNEIDFDALQKEMIQYHLEMFCCFKNMHDAALGAGLLEVVEQASRGMVRHSAELRMLTGMNSYADINAAIEKALREGYWVINPESNEKMHN